MASHMRIFVSLETGLLMKAFDRNSQEDQEEGEYCSLCFCQAAGTFYLLCNVIPTTVPGSVFYDPHLTITTNIKAEGV